MRPLGRGLDHVAYLDGNLVVRIAQGADAAAEVEREAALLAVVARAATVPVPRPVLVDRERGRLGYERLPGVPLLDLPAGRQAQAAQPVGRELGVLLRALDTIERSAVEGLVEVDADEPSAWREEAVHHYAAVAQSIPGDHAAHVERFLAAAPPSRGDAIVFSHNDLGIEHVLVDPSTLAVTGVIDWSDAALTDPAYDFGLLLRDLGMEGLTAAFAGYDLSDTRDLEARARFYARCALLEDLAYGIAENRSEYVAKSVAGLDWVFA